MSATGWMILILSVLAGGSVLLAIIFQLKFSKEKIKRKSETERADTAEDLILKLKRNIAHMAAAISTDYQANEDGKKVVDRIKEAKSDEEAQRILDDLSSRLDGLL